MAGYGDDPGFATWLSDNGYTLPVDAPSPAVLRNRGSQYIDAVYGSRFIGTMTNDQQERQWPRDGSTSVPLAVVHASYYAALQEANAPGSLSVVGSSASAVKREKVGSLEVEYQTASSDGTASSITPLISIVDGMLAPYLRDDAIPYLGIWALGERC